MKAYLLLALMPISARAQTTYFTNTVNERAVSCPEDPNQIGYKHVTDINVDQQNELARIANGEPARKPYIFPLCNRFKFLMEEEVLQVLLDDITFACGYNGKNEELCVLEGGDVQVNIPEGSPNQNVVFQGVSFWGFKGISTKAYGASSSKITFNDATWKNFINGATAVHQMLPAGGVPMQVEVNKANFENGTGSNLFDNVGGTLTFTDMKIWETIRVDSMIRTSAGGTSNLATVDATLSDIVRLTHTAGGSGQTVSGVKIYEMNSLGSILYVEGSGSRLTASNIEVMNNNLYNAYAQTKTSRNFNVLIATDSSTAEINAVSVTDCDGVDRIFSANDGAAVTVTDATISRVVGTQPPDLLSNIAMSEDGGSMNVLRLTASDITAFGAGFFAICGSSIQVKQSCLLSGTAAAPVFISSDSTFVSDGNYIDTTALTVDRCRNNGAASVFFEQSIDDSCFSETGTGACNGQCVAGFTEAEKCQSGNVTAVYTLATSRASSGGGQGNPSCPASPPTPVPTFPPAAAAGAGGPTGTTGSGGAQQPIPSGSVPAGNPGAPSPGGSGVTIPPGNPGAPGTPGGSPASSPGSSPNGSSGSSSGATAFTLGRVSQVLQFGSALLVAKLVHWLMF